MAMLHLFDAFGIELEYMIVDATTLDVRPIADRVLQQLGGGEITADVTIGPITWSNELAGHVLELKMTEPGNDLRNTAAQFQHAIGSLAPILQSLGARLLPTAMHPWMDPVGETELWAHQDHEIYQTYDRVFDCRRHGWANVQSVHLNLPFDGDEEFARLHAAIRLLLPILPAIAASSPISDARLSGYADTRMHHYLHHCDRIASMTAGVVPEPMTSRAQYQQEVFDPIIRDVAQHDRSGLMQPEFMNARGAIARFDRGAIEIRVMDVQENPIADVAICGLVIAVLRHLVETPVGSWRAQNDVATSSLRAILDQTILAGEAAMLIDPSYLRHFEIGPEPLTAGDLWQRLIERHCDDDGALAKVAEPLTSRLSRGTLASVIRDRIGADDSSHAPLDRTTLRETYQQISDCLDPGGMFGGLTY